MKTLEKYLREAMSEGYTDYTNDPDALPAFRSLETKGLIRVIDRSGEAPGLWRLAQSSEQKQAARDWLAAGQI